MFVMQGLGGGLNAQHQQRENIFASNHLLQERQKNFCELHLHQQHHRSSQGSDVGDTKNDPQAASTSPRPST
jgi:hypothetical protein